MSVSFLFFLFALLPSYYSLYAEEQDCFLTWLGKTSSAKLEKKQGVGCLKWRMRTLHDSVIQEETVAQSSSRL